MLVFTAAGCLRGWGKGLVGNTVCHCKFQSSEKSCFFCIVVHKVDEEEGETAKEKSSPHKPMPPAKPKASQELPLEFPPFSPKEIRDGQEGRRGVCLIEDGGVPH